MLTPARQAANHRRKLASLKVKLIAMSVEWEDVDEFFRSRFEELASGFDELDSQLAEFVADEKESRQVVKTNKKQLSLLDA